MEYGAIAWPWLLCTAMSEKSGIARMNKGLKTVAVRICFPFLPWPLVGTSARRFLREAPSK
jgi:hypothetical protein